MRRRGCCYRRPGAGDRPRPLGHVDHSRGDRMLVNGRWSADWHPVQSTDAKGGFVRQTSGFRNWITPDGAPGATGEGGFRAERDRYHLFVALICPWASRTLIARALKGLSFISVSVLEPTVTDQGWSFAGEWDGAAYLHEIYTRGAPSYTGRATVPVLWDKDRRIIVNNRVGRHPAHLQFRIWHFGQIGDRSLSAASPG